MLGVVPGNDILTWLCEKLVNLTGLGTLFPPKLRILVKGQSGIV